MERKMSDAIETLVERLFNANRLLAKTQIMLQMRPFGEQMMVELEIEIEKHFDAVREMKKAENEPSIDGKI